MDIKTLGDLERRGMIEISTGKRIEFYEDWVTYSIDSSNKLFHYKKKGFFKTFDDKLIVFKNNDKNKNPEVRFLIVWPKDEEDKKNCNYLYR